MGSIPVDATGCWVKYTFPNDFVLPSDPLFLYQGKGMMGKVNPNVLTTLTPGSDVYYSHQASVVKGVASTRPNEIVVAGCRTTTGPDKKGIVRFTGIITPAAQKTTGEFKAEVFHTYGASKSTFAAPIMTAGGSIPNTMFLAGTMAQGSFVAPSRGVQAAANVLVSFTLTNNLPSKNSNPLYNSRILIMMPEAMKKGVDADVTQQDTVLVQMKFRWDTTAAGCTGTRACYEITHENTMDVPGGTEIKLWLGGTNNQESVTTAKNY
jgi:hypothetical protein